QLVRERRGREARAEPGRGDHVVAAGVADVGECVVLAEHRDGRAALPRLRGERGVEAEGPAPGSEPLALQHVAEQVVRVALLEAQLGVLEDPVRHLEQHVAAPIDLRPGALDRLTGRAHGCAGCSSTILPPWVPLRSRSSALGYSDSGSTPSITTGSPSSMS